MAGVDAGATVRLRPFADDDVAPLGIVFRAARASMQLFEEPYTVGENIAYIAGLSVGSAITVAEKAGEAVGFLAYSKGPCEAMGLLSHIFVDPNHQGQGVGALLFDAALQRYPAPFHLWCFEANLRARALYDSRGLVITARTDGSQNDENLPDLRYEWHGVEHAGDR